MDDVAAILVDRTLSLREVMLRIDRGAKGIALVVEHDRRLVATITDGDIRRAILSGISLDAAVEQLLEHKRGTPAARPPVTARAGQPRSALLALMKRQRVAQLPLLDEAGRVVDLVTVGTLAAETDAAPADDGAQAELPVQAVIMAGGFGKRLRPLTDELPKPMLPVGGKPLLERTIQRLRQSGVRRINITTHYKPEKIREHFGDGAEFGVALNYVAEDEPLGTAGSVGLLEASGEPLLVMNGDILTSVDFRSLLSFHRQQRAHLTVGVRQYELEVPYGVVEAEGGLVLRLREKPKFDFLVNAGIYLLEPGARQYLPPGQRFDMTDLIAALLADGRRVASFPVVEYWLDIGHIDDFHRAQQDADEMRWAA